MPSTASDASQARSVPEAVAADARSRSPGATGVGSADLNHAAHSSALDLATAPLHVTPLCYASSGRDSGTSSAFHDAHSSTPPSRISSPAPGVSPCIAEPGKAPAQACNHSPFSSAAADTAAAVTPEGDKAASSSMKACIQKGSAAEIAMENGTHPAPAGRSALDTQAASVTSPANSPGQQAGQFGWLFASPGRAAAFDAGDSKAVTAAPMHSQHTQLQSSVACVPLTHGDLARLGMVSSALAHALNPRCVPPLGVVIPTIMKTVAILSTRSAGAPRADVLLLHMVRAAARDPELACKLLGNAEASTASECGIKHLLNIAKARSFTPNQGAMQTQTGEKKMGDSKLVTELRKAMRCTREASSDSIACQTPEPSSVRAEPAAPSSARGTASSVSWDFGAGSKSFKFTASAPPALPAKQLKAVRTVAPPQSQPLIVYGTRTKNMQQTAHDQQRSSVERLPLTFADQADIAKAAAHVQLGAALPGMLLCNGGASNSVLSFTKRNMAFLQARTASTPAQKLATDDDLSPQSDCIPAQHATKHMCTLVWKEDSSASCGSSGAAASTSAAKTPRTHAEGALQPVPPAAAPCVDVVATEGVQIAGTAGEASAQGLAGIAEGEEAVLSAKPTALRSAVMAGGRRVVTKRHGAGKAAGTQGRRTS